MRKSDDPIKQKEFQALINLYKNGDFEGALLTGKQLLLEFPNSVLLYNIIGAVNAELGFWKNAEENYRLAINIEPEYAPTYNNLGIHFKKQGDFAKAIEYYSKAISLKSNYTDAYNNLANIFKYQGKLYDAQKTYEKIININPEYPNAYLNMALILESQGKTEKAIDTYNIAVKKTPNNREALNNLGVLLRNKGSREEAIKIFKKLIQIEPDAADAYNNLGAVLKDQGKLKQAIDAFKMCIHMLPDFSEAHSNLGAALEEIGDIEAAFISYKKALKIKPTDTNTIGNILNLTVGQLDQETIKLCEEAIGLLNPTKINKSELMFLKAKLTKHKGEVEKSFKEFCQANFLKNQEQPGLSEYENNRMSELLKRIDGWEPTPKGYETNKIKQLFIIGPSRTGKTTIERQLSQTPSVLPLSECLNLKFLNKNVNNYELPNTGTFDTLFEHNETDLQNSGYELIVSTSPASVYIIDKIFDVFESSYIVLVNREPIDLGAEIFTRDYKAGNFYSYHPQSIMRYIDVYEKVMHTFYRKSKDRCIAVNYNEIQKHPVRVTEKISQLTDVKFNSQGLDNDKINLPKTSLFRQHFAEILHTNKLG